MKFGQSPFHASHARSHVAFEHQLDVRRERIDIDALRASRLG